MRLYDILVTRLLQHYYISMVVSIVVVFLISNVSLFLTLKASERKKHREL